jgi:hypothetical protein
MLQTPHPVHPLVELIGRRKDGRIAARVGERERIFTKDQLAAFITAREEGIRLEKADPLRYGHEPSSWVRADAERARLREKFPVGVIEEWNLGGNRAGKSERAAKRIVQLMIEKDFAKVWCLQSTEASSIENQQGLIWKYLPTEYKSETGKLRQGTTTKINYSVSGGFTENKLVLPNGSMCVFKFYSMDVKSVEGAELDCAWADELVTPDWLEALRYRLLTRNGLLHVTFTPVAGYTPTVASVLNGAVTTEETEAELLPKITGEGFEKVPLTQQPVMRNAGIVYFHTQENPYGNYPSLKVVLEGKNKETILCRAYGVAIKSRVSRFPRFRDDVHVVDPESIPKEGSNYHIVDPCSGRNWFMIWVRVDIRGRLFVYREWPDSSRYITGVGVVGPWAVPSASKADGDMGDAQKTFGWGLQEYKEEIARLEGDEVIRERLMDSRYASSATILRDGVTTLLDECADIDLDFNPTSGRAIDEGVDLINNALAYDPDKPVAHGNEPRLFISRDCANVIYSLKEWTGADGNKAATKDPLDCVRYAVTAEPELLYVEGDILRPQVHPGGGY